MLALLTGKLLFFDLANHNTLERILSFIAAGVIFLLASYLYSRFSDSFGESSDSEPEVGRDDLKEGSEREPCDRLLTEF